MASEIRNPEGMIVIKGRHVLTPTRILEEGYVAIRGERIVEVGCCVERRDGVIPSPTTDPGRVVDVTGAYVLPGFVDLHVHGGKGHDTMDATPGALEEISRYHAAGGCTSFLATTASSSTVDLLGALDAVREGMGRDLGGAQVLGAHIEGPYFAPIKKGCHLAEFVRSPCLREYEQTLERADAVRSMTLAPEIEGALPLIRALGDAGVVASAGHSNATYDEVLAGIDAGMSHVTHLFCAMSSVTKRGPYRDPGLLEAALTSDDLTAEFIADGRHVPPALIHLALRTKGVDKLCLVTDAMRGAGMPDGTYTFGGRDGQEVIVRDGISLMPDLSGFASGTLRIDALVRHMVQRIGVSLQDAVAMASRNPAKVIGVADRKGSLAEGKNADVVVMDEAMNVVMTMVRGRIVWESEKSEIKDQRSVEHTF